MLRTKHIVTFFGLLSGATLAVSPGEAFLAYEKGEYAKAAVMFSDILSRDSAKAAKEESEYGIAMALLKAKLPIAALRAFQDVVQAGSGHSYFLRAVEGMMTASMTEGAEILSAQLLDGLYDKNLEQLRQLNPDILQHIHYLIANRAFRTGKHPEAIEFAKTVRPGHADYLKAQYLLGLLLLDLGKDGNQPIDYAAARESFERIRRVVPAKEKDQKKLRLRQLASIAIARLLYEQGYATVDDDKRKQELMVESINEYEKIPRFSMEWDDALFEKAWAYTVLGRYVEALGSLHSFEYPTFDNAYYPEKEILASIVYWYNCQWDKATTTLGSWKAKYRPLMASLSTEVQSNRADDTWYNVDVLPKTVSKKIKDDRQYAIFSDLIKSIEAEQKVFETQAVLKNTALAQRMNAYYTKSLQLIRETAGKWVQQNLKTLVQDLKDIETRTQVVSLETKSAEVQWLEQGRQITGKVRQAPPRRYIPNEQFQFWWAEDREGWIDEIGYFRVPVKSECYQ